MGSVNNNLRSPTNDVRWRIVYRIRYPEDRDSWHFVDYTVFTSGSSVLEYRDTVWLAWKKYMIKNLQLGVSSEK